MYRWLKQERTHHVSFNSLVFEQKRNYTISGTQGSFDDEWTWPLDGKTLIAWGELGFTVFTFVLVASLPFPERCAARTRPDENLTNFAVDSPHALSEHSLLLRYFQPVEIADLVDEVRASKVEPLIDLPAAMDPCSKFYRKDNAGSVVEVSAIACITRSRGQSDCATTT